jgi:predicted O-methyltransferase YrrM
MFTMIRRIYAKGLSKARLLKLRLSYDYNEILGAQDKLYSELGFDRNASLLLLEGIYNTHPKVQVLVSEHHALFGALSLKGNVKSVLEIGTYTASCTKLLSILFPGAQISTIDLPDNDPIFRQTYDRGDSEAMAQFIDERNQVIQTCQNVTFVQQNSLQLLHKKDERFDLIWVDGAHGYPVVAMDIVNSLACLSKEGFMFIDDVWLNRSENDPNYRSIGAYESIVALKNAGLIEFDLVPKRIEFPHGEGHMKKYIARVIHSDAAKENVKAAVKVSGKKI